MAVRIMHVDLDAFFVEVCRIVNPDLRDIELLVVGGRRDQRGVVQSASYGARKYGVRSGMPIARAVQLCPGATSYQGEFTQYGHYSRMVRQVLRRFSPTVAMASLDEAYLDFSGTERLYPRSLLPVAEEVRDQVRRETALAVSVGIGPNRMIAKMASEAAKPKGLMEVRAGWERGFMAGFRLVDIPGIGPKTAARLERHGLVDVAQVQRTPQMELEQIVGRQTAQWLERKAAGRGGIRLGGRSGPKSMSRESTLAEDTSDPELLERMLRRFAARVASQLRDRQLTTRTVTLKLRHGDFHTVTRQATLPDPTDLESELIPAALKLFRQAFGQVRKRGKGVRLIGLGATNLAPADPPDLFESEPRRRQRDLSRAMDDVREKYGFGAVEYGGAKRKSDR